MSSWPKEDVQQLTSSECLEMCMIRGIFDEKNLRLLKRAKMLLKTNCVVEGYKKHSLNISEN